jgi:hypothetical protein
MYDNYLPYTKNVEIIIYSTRFFDTITANKKKNIS